MPYTTHKNEVRMDVAALRDSIYRTLYAKYGRLSGLEVLKALHDASEDMYAAGIDHGMQKAKIHDLDNVADAWDLTWLTAFAIRLEQTI